MRDYVVLRSTRRRVNTGAISAGVIPARAVEPIRLLGDDSDPPEPRFDTEGLEPWERDELLADPEVLDIAPAMPIQLVQPLAAGTGGDGDAWGITAVRAERCDFTGRGVTVAVLDTGIDPGHEAFRGMAIVEQDFTGTGNGDRHGHGTHCAGTIFGRAVGGERIGVATGVTTALVGKVLDDNGRGTSASVFRGIQWATERGARVISLSLGFDFPGMVRGFTDDGWPVELATSIALEAYRGSLRLFDTQMALLRAQEGTGSVVVAAAGNESRRDTDPPYAIATTLPAAADGVLSVGAVGRAGDQLRVAPFSNTFPKVCAPGVDIRSARAGGGTAVMSGTSMAGPHVAGVAALCWQQVCETGLPAHAQTVLARVLAAARTEVFAADVPLSDRGHGLVTAP